MREIVESLLEILYPEKNICCICNKTDESTSGGYICSTCLSSLKRIVPPVCNVCGKHISHDADDAICRDCAINEKNFRAARAPFRYVGAVKECLHMMKYNNKPYYFRFFGSFMTEYVTESELKDFEVVTCVPIHASRLRSRGYNQARLLARYVAVHTDRPYADTLSRRIQTPAQSQQSRFARLRNLNGAFCPQNKKAAGKIRGLKVLLVDDIYTTGATALECTKVLLEMGADAVYVLTAAR